MTGPAGGPNRRGGPLTGTLHLARLVLRRDRVLLPIWVLLIAVLPAFYAATYAELYPTAAQRAEYALTTAGNPSIVALLGPLHGDSVGALTAQRAGLLHLIVGLISLLVVVRHTRTEEEAGRRELLGATVLGRYAGLAAALLVTCAADLLLGLLVTGGLVAADQPAAGSLAFGLSVALAGIVFAAVGALAAQLTESAAGARGLGLSMLGAAYLLRLAGDAGDREWLSRLSPLGWAQRTHPYAGERWWPLALLAGLAALVGAAAFRLSVRRDLGAGVLPQRLGPPTAGPALAGPWGLAWRLHRGSLLGWTVCAAALGAVLGGAADAAGNAVHGNETLARVIERLGGSSALAEAYLGAALSIVALAAAGCGIQAALRMRAEETAQRAEPVLATGVGRSRWLLSHLVFALLGPAVMLAVTGAATGLSYGLSVSDVAGRAPRLTGAALAHVPAVWVLVGLTVLLFGLLPRLSVGGAWAALAACLLLGQLGSVLELSQWLLDLSPFTHTPQLLGATVDPLPLLALTATSAALLALGLATFRRRDLPTP
ncbi:ABC transporter permease [Micromonospora okii]|uniref:ABC transporter permease n=1 Tax=Micromonospora okii TaxID=1182970 RepID=UPI001E5CAAAA|nr:ABC transporter permease [Micromonospora okii]